MERLLFIIQHWWICYNTQHIVQISFMVWFTVQGVYLLQGMQSKVSAYSLIKVRSLIHCIVHLLLYCDNCNLFERIYIHVKLWLIVVMRVKFFFSGQSLNMGYVISFVCMWGLTILLMRYQRGRNEMIQVKHAQQQDFTVLLQISLGLKTDCILGSCGCCDSGDGNVPSFSCSPTLVLNISTAIALIAIQFCTDICVPQMINPDRWSPDIFTLRTSQSTFVIADQMSAKLYDIPNC